MAKEPRVGWILLDGQDPTTGALPFDGEHLGLHEDEIDGAYAGYVPIFATEALAQEAIARLGGDLLASKRVGAALVEAVSSDDWHAYAFLLIDAEGREVVIPEEFDVRDWYSLAPPEPNWSSLPAAKPPSEADRAKANALIDRMKEDSAQVAAVFARLLPLLDEACGDGPWQRLKEETFALAGRSRMPITGDVMIVRDPRIMDEWSRAIGNPTAIIDVVPSSVVELSKGRVKELAKLKSLTRYVMIRAGTDRAIECRREGNELACSEATRLVIPEIGLDVRLADLATSR